MNKTNLISLIENDQIEEFVQQVFKNRIVDKVESFYTLPLSDDEEKALAHRMATEQKSSGWYKALSDYVSHYPLSNAAMQYLLTGIGNSLAVKIICLQIVKYGYTPEQGEEICSLIKKDSENKTLLPLLPLISKYGRRFDDTLYSILWSIDERLRARNSEKFDYADSYKKNVHEYRKQNGLLRFTI